MNANSGPPIVIGVIVVMTIAAGIWSVGGPATGKQEKRDKARMSDMGNLSRHVGCLAKAADGILPEILPAGDDTPQACVPVPRLSDPFTDQPYEYERISMKNYRLCAGFEHPELIAYPKDLDKTTGCITYHFNR